MCIRSFSFIFEMDAEDMAASERGRNVSVYKYSPHGFNNPNVYLAGQKVRAELVVQLSHTPHCFEGVRIMFVNRPWAIRVL